MCFSKCEMAKRGEWIIMWVWNPVFFFICLFFLHICHLFVFWKQNSSVTSSCYVHLLVSHWLNWEVMYLSNVHIFFAVSYRCYFPFNVKSVIVYESLVCNHTCWTSCIVLHACEYVIWIIHRKDHSAKCYYYCYFYFSFQKSLVIYEIPMPSR